MNTNAKALIVGGGPAGLMAAEALSGAGISVLVTDAKPSFGRKFLMAGKSGLNITRDQPSDAFVASYTKNGAWLEPMLTRFGPKEVRDWASGLGIETFSGSSGRVFPSGMKASPLLRAWLGRLSSRGVQFRTNWRWSGFDGSASRFITPDGEKLIQPTTTVLAMGGASWSRLGSDGAWADVLKASGIAVDPFVPSNMGFNVNWSAHMTKHFGQAVKPVKLSAAEASLKAEFVITAKGVEGGGIYALSHLLRENGMLELDLLPDLDITTVHERLSRHRGKSTISNHLRRSLGLPPVKIALLREFAEHPPGDLRATASTLKHLKIPLTSPAPLDQAISTGGGVRRDELTSGLMLRRKPGVFCAGEMLDWDAPTGGYLLTACLATGLHAGDTASAWVDANSG